MTIRFPDIEGSINFRDLGGYATGDGSQLRWGRLFRSGHFHDLSQTGWAALQALDPAAVIDLREDYEREAIPTHWPGGPAPALLHAPRSDFDNAALLDMPADLASARARRVSAYRAKPAQFAAALRLVVEQLAAEPARPVVFHCMGGKDRTGFVAAVLLDWLGVSRADILADYLLTGQRISKLNPASLRKIMQLYALDQGGPAALQAMTEVQPQYLEAALEVLDSEHGGAEAYLLATGLAPQLLADLRTSLLTPQPS